MVLRGGWFFSSSRSGDGGNKNKNTSLLRHRPLVSQRSFFWSMSAMLGLLTISTLHVNIKYIKDASRSSDADINNVMPPHLKAKAQPQQCLRFATMGHIKSAGLGHKLFEVVLGMNFALETNSRYVYDPDIWFISGKHGSYEWILQFLPLQYTEMTTHQLRDYQIERKQELKVVEGGQWVDLVSKSKNYDYSCNVLFQSMINKCCHDGLLKKEKCYCTYDPNQIGSADRVKWQLREAFSKSTYKPSQHLSNLVMAPVSSESENGENGKGVKLEGAITIAWHLRVGDIVLNNNADFFTKIAEQISTAVQTNNTTNPVPAQIFFIGEGSKETLLESFPFIPEICLEYFKGNCFFPFLNVQDTFYYMITSDVLVTSGSSFSAAAAIIRSKGITLSAIPKENVVGIYEVTETLQMDSKGTIEEGFVSKIQNHIRVKNAAYQ